MFGARQYLIARLAATARYVWGLRQGINSGFLPASITKSLALHDPLIDIWQIDAMKDTTHMPPVLTSAQHYTDLDQLLSKGRADLSSGPLAVILAEDPVELSSTIAHHAWAGFQHIVVLLNRDVTAEAPEALPNNVALSFVSTSGFDTAGAATLVTRIARAVPAGTWLYYGFNAEYLFHPFCESRSIGEMLAFHAEERRDAMLTYVVDLYSDDLSASPNAVDLARAHLDQSGYYALPRLDPENHNHPKERQLEFFGGLRWRFEEHVPVARRRIDRISIFRTRPDLTLYSDFTLSDEEMNTYACPWHHNLTAAVCSFRIAKALKHNPGSRYDIETFKWHNSVKFSWNSQQLLELGLMEPGQWF